MKESLPLTESQYNELLDGLMLAIEDAIDDSGLDIDYETSAGILTLTCEDNSKIILSRQTPLLQLWVAARSGGFHFDYNDEQGDWLLDGRGESFISLLNRCLTEQSGETVQLVI
ncbi:iron donor protein CyaY [Endozoicomonas elysicola]|uniref:Iron-sulfur cluster assembly protein CyaY n=1 Tax=Endozoicomonas elysicola TaxID=305900 RepID=A0A081K7I9_9GAMM|nr:iron donor protein CyaY [Endozoicomonas elysicola]KEI70115.1 frataxin [Endozoicomonas elysicola]